MHVVRWSVLVVCVACGASRDGFVVLGHRTRLSEPVRCELETPSDVTLWARRRFPYAEVHSDVATSTLMALENQADLLTSLVVEGWELEGEVDPSVHPVLFIERNVRISPVVELGRGSRVLIRWKGDLVAAPPQTDLDDAGLRILRGGDARVGCADLSMIPTSTGARWSPTAEVYDASPVPVYDRPNGTLSAWLLADPSAEVAVDKVSADHVHVTFRYDDLWVRGWIPGDFVRQRSKRA